MTILHEEVSANKTPLGSDVYRNSYRGSHNHRGGHRGGGGDSGGSSNRRSTSGNRQKSHRTSKTNRKPTLSPNRGQKRNKSGEVKLDDRPLVPSGKVIACQWAIYGCYATAPTMAGIMQHEQEECRSKPEDTFGDAVKIFKLVASVYTGLPLSLRHITPPIARAMVAITPYMGTMSIHSASFLAPLIPHYIPLKNFWAGRAGQPTPEGMRTALTVPATSRLGVEGANSLFKRLSPDEKGEPKCLEGVHAVKEFLEHNYPLTLPDWIRVGWSGEDWNINSAGSFGDLTSNRAQASIAWTVGASTIYFLWPPSFLDSYLACYAYQKCAKGSRINRSLLEDMLKKGGSECAPHIAILDPSRDQSLYVPQGWIRCQYTLVGGYTGSVSWIPDFGVDTVSNAIKKVVEEIRRYQKLESASEEVKTEIECTLGEALGAVQRMAACENPTYSDIGVASWERLNKMVETLGLKELYESPMEKKKLEIRKL